MGDFINFLGNNLADFWTYTGFANATGGHIAMIIIGLGFIYLAVAKEFEPMLLIPIGFGILIGNIPFNMDAGLKVGIYEEGSVLNILYQGVTSGWYPPLIFLGIGAMTDFSALISNPKLMLIGAAAQFGIFGAYMIALEMGFDPMQAGAIGIIGGADGPTAIFLSSKLAPNLMGAIAVSAYSYMALVPVIQPPIMRLLTTKHERVIRMKPPRAVSHTEKVIFPIIGLLLTCFLVPSGLPLLGMLFFGNLLKESGVTRRLANTASGPLIDVITILLGLTVGASTQASEFLTLDSIKIFDEKKGKVKLIPWDRQIEKNYKKNKGSVLASGPLMLKDGEYYDWSQCNANFIETKHPRSAICLTEEGKILFVTVDGRSPENAVGINIPELAHLLHVLGGKDALNLDGGGSTALWLSGAPEEGIVNFPCDNRNYDHQGERKVANFLYVH